MGELAGSLLQGKRVLLIITGGIAAYKTLDLIRRLRVDGAHVKPVMTRSAHQFVTALSVGVLSGTQVHEDLFSSTNEMTIDHIRLVQENDLILIAPASANFLARIALGLADDLATALLLAAGDCPVLAAPAMNTRMWDNPATQHNVARLKEKGVVFVGPMDGFLAEGEYGIGRLAEPEQILFAVRSILDCMPGALSGHRIVVTSGPTHEMIDPLRYIGNRSSGLQGHAIAEVLAARGAEVTLVTGPVSLPDPKAVRVMRVTSAQEMLEVVKGLQPMDVFIGAAAVSDWRVASVSPQKIKKSSGSMSKIDLVENQDILAHIAMESSSRPRLIVGFAAETEQVIDHALQKRKAKGCDWILANNVALVGGSVAGGIMGSAESQVSLVTAEGVENWPLMHKRDIAWKLASRIENFLNDAGSGEQ